MGGVSLRMLFQMKPAVWRWGRAVRAAVCVGAPFAAGLMLGDIMTGMWIAMGCLMMATGESHVPYRQVYLTVLISAPIGALGYLLGYLGALPWSLVVLGMMLFGLLAGILSGRSHALSLGTMQTLLLASIAIGVPAIAPFWQPAILYLAGAIFYALVLGIEVLIFGWHAQDAPARPLASEPPRAAHKELGARPLVQAVALALCLGVAYASHWFDQAPHWFWIPLTVGLVMKPDLGPILDRSLLRIVGTLAGVAIGALLLSFVGKGYIFVLIMAALAGVLPWAMQRSYWLQAVFLTPLILMLVDVIIPGTHDVDFALQRLIDTVIGCAIVLLVGYLPWRRSFPYAEAERSA
jgi:hypothetical protein